MIYCIMFLNISARINRRHILRMRVRDAGLSDPHETNLPMIYRTINFGSLYAAQAASFGGRPAIPEGKTSIHYFQ